MDKIILVGAGGHARSCIDVIELTGFYKIAGLVEKDNADGNENNEIYDEGEYFIDTGPDGCFSENEDGDGYCIQDGEDPVYDAENNPDPNGDNYNSDPPNHQKWKGVALFDATDQTIFDYVRISNSRTWGESDDGLHGGGLSLNNSHPSISHTVIDNNITTGSGGGIKFAGSHPVFTDVTISNNSSARGGGGIYLHESEATFTNSNIINNEVLGGLSAGGGIYAEYNSSVTLNSCNIINNTAPYEGAGLFARGVTLTTLINSNIINNYTTPNCTDCDQGGSIKLLGYSTKIIMVNCIAWGNRDIIIQDNGDTLFVTNSFVVKRNSLPLYVVYSDIENYEDEMEELDWEGFDQVNWILEEMIDVDPLFTDPDSGDYSLSWENYPAQDSTMSPCIDAGTAYLSDYGQDDITDYMGNAPDIGAFESEYVTTAIILGCTDPEAINYDPEATVEDGSCEYSSPEGPDFAISIEAGSNEHSLDMTVGFSPDATDGYDEGIDSYSPPAPPPPSFNVALGWEGDRYYTQILAGLAEDEGVEHVFDIQLQYDTNNLITLSWDNTGWAGLGSFILQDAFGGVFINFDMLTGEGTVNPAYATLDGTTLSLINPAVTTLKLKVTPAATTTSANVEYLEGWNMVGLPILVEDTDYLTLFPEAYTGALYSYNNSYQLETILTPGTGYWLRLASGGITSFSGQPINELALPLTEGWNLISGISSQVDVNVLYNSGIIATGAIYGYDGSYTSAETIDPGMGYWMRALNDGEITLSSTAFATKTVEQVNHLEGSNTLELSNGTHSSTLYFGKDVADEHKNSYSLPPTFPQMAFDARFTDNMKYIQDAGEISVINTNSRLTLNYSVNLDPGEHQEWVLTTNSGKEHILNRTGGITLPPETKGMSLEKRAIFPDVYALYQNYPNPFNPVTKITYQLPEESYVAVTIYNLAGQKVTTLVDGRRSGGFHAVDWYGENSKGESVASGLYFFRIEAENFSKTLKMLLLK